MTSLQSPSRSVNRRAVPRLASCPLTGTESAFLYRASHLRNSLGDHLLHRPELANSALAILSIAPNNATRPQTASGARTAPDARKSVGSAVLEPDALVDLGGRGCRRRDS